MGRNRFSAAAMSGGARRGAGLNRYLAPSISNTFSHDVRAIGAASSGTALAMLDDDGAGISRVGIGREADEQGVVAFLPRVPLVLVQIADPVGGRDTSDLRGAGFAADLDAAGSPSCAARAVPAGPCTTRCMPLVTMSRCSWGTSSGGTSAEPAAGRTNQGTIARPPLHSRVAMVASWRGVVGANPWPIPLTSVSPCIHDCLYRAFFQARVGIRPGELAGQIDPHSLPKAELPRDLRDLVDTYPPSQVIVEHIARLLESLNHVERAVAVLAPAVEIARCRAISTRCSAPSRWGRRPRRGLARAVTGLKVAGGCCPRMHLLSGGIAGCLAARSRPPR